LLPKLCAVFSIVKNPICAVYQSQSETPPGILLAVQRIPEVKPQIVIEIKAMKESLMEGIKIVVADQLLRFARTGHDSESN
jgi:hypothetical protein